MIGYEMSWFYPVTRVELFLVLANGDTINWTNVLIESLKTPDQNTRVRAKFYFTSLEKYVGGHGHRRKHVDMF